jgi:hypothetical protein
MEDEKFLPDDEDRQMPRGARLTPSKRRSMDLGKGTAFSSWEGVNTEVLLVKGEDEPGLEESVHSIFLRGDQQPKYVP